MVHGGDLLTKPWTQRSSSQAPAAWDSSSASRSAAIQGRGAAARRCWGGGRSHSRDWTLLSQGWFLRPKPLGCMESGARGGRGKTGRGVCTVEPSSSYPQPHPWSLLGLNKDRGWVQCPCPVTGCSSGLRRGWAPCTSGNTCSRPLGAASLSRRLRPVCTQPGRGHSGHPVEEVGWAVRVKAGPSHTLTPG